MSDKHQITKRKVSLLKNKGNLIVVPISFMLLILTLIYHMVLLIICSTLKFSHRILIGLRYYLIFDIHFFILWLKYYQRYNKNNKKECKLTFILDLDETLVYSTLIPPSKSSQNYFSFSVSIKLIIVMQWRTILCLCKTLLKNFPAPFIYIRRYSSV